MCYTGSTNQRKGNDVTVTETELNPLAEWLATINDLDAETRAAAEEFLAADAAAKLATEAREVARDKVIVTFGIQELDRFAGVLCSPTDKREFDHAAAARLNVDNLTEPRTTAKRVDACLAAGTLTRRQYRRIVTSHPTFTVQPESVKVPVPQEAPGAQSG